jgi:hypothetical protein
MEDTHKRIGKRIEIAANIGIVIVAILIITVWVTNLRKQAAEPARIATGAKLAITDVNWRGNGRTMVFALATTCHFCSESAGFYRELVQYCSSHSIPTIAVFPQTAAEGRSYLANEGVKIDEVRQASFSSIQISGTPTLLLIDENGSVKGVWVGKLSPGDEKKVLSQLGS